MVGKREEGVTKDLVVCYTWLFDGEPAWTLETTLYYKPLQTSRERRRDKEEEKGGERERWEETGDRKRRRGGRKVMSLTVCKTATNLEVLVPKTWLKVCPDAFMGGAGY